MITVNERPLRNLLRLIAIERLTKNKTPNQPEISCLPCSKKTVYNNAQAAARI
jgi:hypothetical protein